jgi:2,4-dichlorophenol 6-monooxygenase
VVADGSPPTEPIDDIRVNAPSTRPGAPLTHAWIDDEDGNRCDGDLYDTRSDWLRHRQIESDGAILVRPDRFIAWRHPTSAEDPRAVLADPLRRILGRATDRAAAGA